VVRGAAQGSKLVARVQHFAAAAAGHFESRAAAETLEAEGGVALAMAAAAGPAMVRWPSTVAALGWARVAGEEKAEKAAVAQVGASCRAAMHHRHT